MNIDVSEEIQALRHAKRQEESEIGELCEAFVQAVNNFLQPQNATPARNKFYRQFEKEFGEHEIEKYTICHPQRPIRFHDADYLKNVMQVAEIYAQCLKGADLVSEFKSKTSFKAPQDIPFRISNECPNFAAFLGEMKL